MASQTSTIQVADAAQLRQAVDSYIVQGYSVATQDAQSATMRKAKEFQVLWAVIGFFLCLLPLLIYLIVYATQSDQVVRIIIGASTPALTLSSDGNWWWSFEQSRWIGVLEHLPAGAPRSEDGAWWWDGANWRRLPMPQDTNADGRITTDDASPSPAGEPGPHAQTIRPRPGDPLPPPTA